MRYEVLLIQKSVTHLGEGNRRSRGSGLSYDPATTLHRNTKSCGMNRLGRIRRSKGRLDSRWMLPGASSSTMVPSRTSITQRITTSYSSV